MVNLVKKYLLSFFVAISLISFFISTLAHSASWNFNPENHPIIRIQVDQNVFTIFVTVAKKSDVRALLGYIAVDPAIPSYALCTQHTCNNMIGQVEVNHNVQQGPHIHLVFNVNYITPDLLARILKQLGFLNIATIVAGYQTFFTEAESELSAAVPAPLAVEQPTQLMFLAMLSGMGSPGNLVLIMPRGFLPMPDQGLPQRAPHQTLHHAVRVLSIGSLFAVSMVAIFLLYFAG